MLFNHTQTSGETIFSTLLTYYPGTKKHNYADITTTVFPHLATTVTLVCM